MPAADDPDTRKVGDCAVGALLCRHLDTFKIDALRRPKALAVDQESHVAGVNQDSRRSVHSEVKAGAKGATEQQFPHMFGG